MLLDPPNVTVEADAVVAERDNVSIACNTDGGNPDYVNRYRWEFTSKYTMKGIQTKFDCEEKKCTIQEISPTYAGDYKCTADNNWGGELAHSTTKLDVHCK